MRFGDSTKGWVIKAIKADSIKRKSLRSEEESPFCCVLLKFVSVYSAFLFCITLFIFTLYTYVYMVLGFVHFKIPAGSSILDCHTRLTHCLNKDGEVSFLSVISKI